ncbi:AAA family ATPase [Nocardioides alcanivorans]|uniref:AAA family ATPase n=1 Tax=Nocardioides alcanivorans TaxID=2897352 RepID=UPI00289A38AE|nr:AAA family ATPase [Nocardioides alcanivorans]
MIEEIRIQSLGVIESSTMELGPGLTVITGETGAGKTMVVTALGLLLGGRADSGAVRTGATRARVEGIVDATALARFRGSVEESGEWSRTAGYSWPATSRPRGVRAPSPAARRCR